MCGGVCVLVGAAVFKTVERQELPLVGSIPIRLRYLRICALHPLWRNGNPTIARRADSHGRSRFFPVVSDALRDRNPGYPAYPAAGIAARVPEPSRHERMP